VLGWPEGPPRDSPLRGAPPLSPMPVRAFALCALPPGTFLSKALALGADLCVAFGGGRSLAAPRLIIASSRFPGIRIDAISAVQRLAGDGL
jgi:hypothetical protein